MINRILTSALGENRLHRAAQFSLRSQMPGLIPCSDIGHFFLIYTRKCSSKLKIIFKHQLSLDLMNPQQPAQLTQRSRMVESNIVFTNPACLKNGVLGFLLGNY